MTNLSRPDASFGVEKQHRNCVRSVAVEALVKTKFVKKEVVKDKLASGYRFTCTLQVAGKVVDEVFDRCYADLEPIGRRARYQYFSILDSILNKYVFRNGDDIKRAEDEKFLFGYS